MSRTDPDYSAYTSICDYCGLPINDDGQSCPALDDGRCEP